MPWERLHAQHARWRHARFNHGVGWDRVQYMDMDMGGMSGSELGMA